MCIRDSYSHVPSDELVLETDITSNESIFAADVLVTDWSSISCEFSFATLKPTLFIDTPMKVGNPNWEQLGIDPTDITLRNQIGVSLSPENLSGFGAAVDDMIRNSGRWNEAIREVRDSFIFNIGDSAPVAGGYILEAVLRQQQRREDAREMHPLDSVSYTHLSCLGNDSNASRERHGLALEL